MSTKQKLGAATSIGLMLAITIYIALNTLFHAWPSAPRLDVTEERLYTLSTATRSVLATIDEPISIDFFYSEKLGRELPIYRAYARRVRDLLLEIEATADGKLNLTEHNPEPFIDAEDFAVAAGLQGVPLNQGGELAYFGLSGINLVDETRVIPFFQTERENLLEYDLVEIIYALSNARKTTIGLVSSLPLLGDMAAQSQRGLSQPWAIARHLNSAFDLVNLPPSFDDLPDDIDILMVVHPQSLPQRTLYEIEQFLFRGGRALFFIDPKSESDFSKGPELVSSSADGLDVLLEKWGIEIPAGQLVGDRSMALDVNAGSAEQPIPAQYLVWLKVPQGNMDQDDPISSQLAVINLATAGYIVRKPDSPLTLSPLIYADEHAARVAVQSVSGLRPDIVGLMNRFKPDDAKYVMAGRLSGTLTTAFPAGPPARQVPADTPPRPQLTQSTSAVNMVVVADSDLLEDRFWIRKQQFFGREVEEQIARNADFVLNAVSNLSGSDEILQLRSRGTAQRPFDRVLALRQRAELTLRDREQALQNKLEETKTRIQQYEGTNSAGKLGENLDANIAMTEEQRSDLVSLREQMLSIRKELRGVEFDLRADEQALERRLQFLNIGLMPLTVAIAGLMLYIVSRFRRRRQHAVIHTTVS